MSCGVGHVAGVFGAVLWLQVLQRERPLRPLALARGWQAGVVLPPGDGGWGVAIGQALETHRTAHWLLQDPSPHLSGLAEAWFDCRGQWSFLKQWTMPNYGNSNIYPITTQM